MVRSVRGELTELVRSLIIPDPTGNAIIVEAPGVDYLARIIIHVWHKAKDTDDLLDGDIECVEVPIVTLKAARVIFA